MCSNICIHAYFFVAHDGRQLKDDNYVIVDESPIAERLMEWCSWRPSLDTSFVSLSQHGLNPMAPDFYPQCQRPRKAKKQLQPKNTTFENTQQKEQLYINKPEEDWQLRLQKRRSLVVSIKETPVYQAASALRERSHQTALRTPSPDDRSVSKRQWEEKVMKWRNALKHKQLNGLATKTNASA